MSHYRLKLTKKPWLDNPLWSDRAYPLPLAREEVLPPVLARAPLPPYCDGDAGLEKIKRVRFLIGGEIEFVPEFESGSPNAQ